MSRQFLTKRCLIKVYHFSRKELTKNRGRNRPRFLFLLDFLADGKDFTDQLGFLRAPIGSVTDQNQFLFGAADRSIDDFFTVADFKIGVGKKTVGCVYNT